jgi:dienelactone hydrolase
MKALVVLLIAVTADARDYKLPDPLKSTTGKPVTAAEWRKHRRVEVLDLFATHIYGRSPATTRTTFKKATEQDNRREVDITTTGPQGSATFRLTIYLPAKRTGRVPVFLLLNNRGSLASQVNNPFFPVDKIVARGYAAAGITLGEVAPDNPQKYREGVIRAHDGPDESSPDRWRTIAAWAWGAQRAMDYLQTDTDIDPKRVAVIGHSRGGKAALWAGAQDERFALTISNNSGESGAALARRREGETVAKINTSFPHWFAENYKKYNDREDDLPVDQHELIALLAPRLAYVASAQDDAWADPLGEFLSCVHATPVYRLLGVPGVGATEHPPVEQPVQSGRIGYHMRKGGHGLIESDWQRFMDFADKHWK